MAAGELITCSSNAVAHRWVWQLPRSRGWASRLPSGVSDLIPSLPGKGQSERGTEGIQRDMERGRGVWWLYAGGLSGELGQLGRHDVHRNHDDVVYQKDLGPNTAVAAHAMRRFNPDSTWTRL